MDIGTSEVSLSDIFDASEFVQCHVLDVFSNMNYQSNLKDQQGYNDGVLDDQQDDEDEANNLLSLYLKEIDHEDDLVSMHEDSTAKENLHPLHSSQQNNEQEQALSLYMELLGLYESQLCEFFVSCNQECQDLLDHVDPGSDLGHPEEKMMEEKFKKAVEKLKSQIKPEPKRSNFTKEVVGVLQGWFEQNIDYPYPTDKDKDELSKKTGINPSQVSNWFLNRRKRDTKIAKKHKVHPVPSSPKQHKLSQKREIPHSRHH